MCVREEWRNPKGRYCEVCACKALLRMAAELHLPLRADRRLWAALLARHHPLSPGRAPGWRLTYLLEAGCGPLGVPGFVAAPSQLGPCDRVLQGNANTRGHGI
ncbi:MAG: hypothetical protein OXN97_18735 [Bryobacterales bacterium]|nr:hypothetical protein [Bryobacterales bacterium]MDE0629382.1 hypothetical protein [Bryobacterales bacterium]